MVIAIHQPQYLPWLGYFDKIDRADIFVFLDDVQFKKNEWQNRNKIKTACGWQWITVPVIHDFGQAISEVRINNRVNWRRQHLKSLTLNYKKARYFDKYISFFENVYSQEWLSLSELNIYIIENLLKILGIETKLERSSKLKLPGKATERLVEISRKLGAGTYLSGAGGRLYLEIEKFKSETIGIIFQDFLHPRYDQLYCQRQDFLENLSIVDLLFNQGEKSRDILKNRL